MNQDKTLSRILLLLLMLVSTTMYAQEIKDQTITVKNLVSGEQQTFKTEEFLK